MPNRNQTRKPSNKKRRAMRPKQRSQAPRRKRTTRPSANSWIVRSASEFLTTVIGLAVATTDGGLLVDQSLAPVDLSNSALQRFCSLYEKYSYRSVTIKYTPSIASTVNASFIAYYEPDPNDARPGSDTTENIRRAYAHTNRKFSANRPFSWTLPVSKNEFWTGAAGSAARLSSPGRFVVIQETEVTGFAGATIASDITTGTVEIVYSIGVKSPNLGDEITTGAGTTQGPDLYNAFSGSTLPTDTLVVTCPAPTSLVATTTDWDDNKPDGAGNGQVFIDGNPGIEFASAQPVDGAGETIYRSTPFELDEGTHTLTFVSDPIFRVFRITSTSTSDAVEFEIISDKVTSKRLGRLGPVWDDISTHRQGLILQAGRDALTVAKIDEEVDSDHEDGEDLGTITKQFRGISFCTTTCGAKMGRIQTDGGLGWLCTEGKRHNHPCDGTLDE